MFSQSLRAIALSPVPFFTLLLRVSAAPSSVPGPKILTFLRFSPHINDQFACFHQLKEWLKQMRVNRQRDLQKHKVPESEE